ncbi:hypothetical protein [Mycolicibacterium fortuitum]|nr:hypothetical protein [Mycolicibacterium fortuitum]OBI76359.1 hypothetical protein A5664_23005 [Mycolicibacterium fortuitum]
MTGIDASVEIVHELDRLCQSSVVAEHAPRSKTLYAYLARGMQEGDASGAPSHEFMDITNRLIQKLGIWWSPQAYSQLPVIVPWCVRDRSCRYDHGPESWGAPRNDGYLRDDNSIIKKLPLTCVVSAPPDHPYRDRKPWRGFTACHIWRDMPDGTLAGADPWLYSFMPNLIWLPSWLSPLTDRQSSEVQRTLQRTSMALFREAKVPSQLQPYAEYGWSKLHEPPPGYVLPVDRLAMFDPHEKFFRNRINYLDKMVAGTQAVLTCGSLPAKLICSRYTVGLPQLDRAAIFEFGTAMKDYRNAVVNASSARHRHDPPGVAKEGLKVVRP